MTAPNDADILAYAGFHPDYGDVNYERVRQDRRTYYRLVGKRLPSFGLTDAKHEEGGRRLRCDPCD